jgi:single-strand selective monofunctional uracil DNA glycosylase
VDLEAFIDRVKEQAEDADRLVASLRLAKTDRVLNVHSYAWDSYEAFLRKYYSDGEPRIFAISMNPGPFGAVQTGIPFTDKAMAREFLPNFDALVKGPPAWARSDRKEMSAGKLIAWSADRFGGIEGLYRKMILGMTAPIAILRAPKWTNVPLPALPRKEQDKVYAFIHRHAAHEIKLTNPLGVFILGEWAERVWEIALDADPTLEAIPSVAVPHPAAHISNDAKFAAWDAGYEELVTRIGRNVPGGKPINLRPSRRPRRRTTSRPARPA